MPLESTSTKRRRTDSGLLEKPTVKRSNNIWFDDGNVVLQADRTQFRVHRSVLAKQSSVFRDMFGITQPEGASEDWVDGCPVVHLPGDTAEDWEYLLSTIFRAIKLNCDWPSVPQLTAMIRLGKKYQFSGLRREACKLLKDKFPRTLAVFDLAFSASGPASLSGSALWIMFNAQSIIYLAEEAGIRSILPVAYFVALGFYPINSTRDAIFSDSSALPSHHLRALINGRIKIYADAVEHLFKWTHEGTIVPATDCSDSFMCIVRRTTFLMVLFQRLGTGKIFPLDTWTESRSVPAPNLCDECQKAAMHSFEAGRVRIWENLPMYFLGTTWNELHDDMGDLVGTEVGASLDAILKL